MPLIINHKVDISGGPSSWPLTVMLLESRLFFVCSKNCTITFHGDVVLQIARVEAFWDEDAYALEVFMTEVRARLVCPFWDRLLCCACTPAAAQGEGVRVTWMLLPNQQSVRQPEHQFCRRLGCVHCCQAP